MDFDEEARLYRMSATSALRWWSTTTDLILATAALGQL
jgi:hypothetical protein